MGSSWDTLKEVQKLKVSSVFSVNESLDRGSEGMPRMLLLMRAWHPELEMEERWALRDAVEIQSFSRKEPLFI